MKPDEMDSTKTIEVFRLEIEAMGKRYQEEAMRLASLRMYEIVYEPEKILPSKKPPVKKFRKSSKNRVAKKKSGAEYKKSHWNDAGSLIIDLDPVTNKPIRFSYVDEDDNDEQIR